MHNAHLINFLADFNNWVDRGCGRHPLFVNGMNVGAALAKWCKKNRVGGEHAAQMGFVLGQAMVSQFTINVAEMEANMAKRTVYGYIDRLRWLQEDLSK